MTSRRLLILAALAIVVLAGALLLSRQQSVTADKHGEQLLYPELKSNLDAVDTVRIIKAGNVRVVEAKRNGSRWVISDRTDYAADDAKIRKFLITTAEAKVLEEKTSNPANYAALGVQDVSEPTASGHRVEINGKIKPIVLIVGKQASGARSQYVRRSADKQSWLISDSLDLPTTIDTWLRKEIIDLSADRIQSASIAIAGAKPYSLTKTKREDSDFTVARLPKGKELSSPGAANGVSFALAGLTLADVRKAEELRMQSPAAHATFKTFDGLVAAVDGWTQENKHYIAIAPSYDAAQAQQFKMAEPAAKPDADAKSTPATKTTPDRDVAADAKTLAAQLAGWAYEIPEYKYAAIFKPLDELLKK